MDLKYINTSKLVEIINSELKKNNSISVNKICQELGISRRTVSSRLSRGNYIFDKELRVYRKKGIMVKDSSNIIQKYNKSISDDEKIKLTKEELNDIKEIIALKDDLRAIIQEYNKSISDSRNILKIDSNKFNGDIKTRLIKTYSNINSEWIEFCKEYKEYKQQDLYSMALLEFMEKYKNK